MDDEKVRCADCGFLCTRNESTKEIREVEQESRETGIGSISGINDVSFEMDLEVRCFAVAFNLPAELESAEGDRRARQVIYKERPCGSFTKWRPGFTPKEHANMTIVDEIRKAESEQRERDRTWQEDRRREDLEWREKQEVKAEARWAKEHHTQRSQLIIVGIVGTVVLALAQIVGSLIQAGIWLPQSKEPPVINIHLPASDKK